MRRVGANEGGGLLPTLAFGIPGGESMALLLIAFINMGIAPGPQMLTTHLDVVFTLVWIVVIASVLTSGIGLLASPWLARMPTLKGNLVIPIVLCVCFLGAFATRGRLADVARRGAVRRARLLHGQVPLLARQPRDRHGARDDDRAQPARLADALWRRLPDRAADRARDVHADRPDHRLAVRAHLAPPARRGAVGEGPA